MLDPEDCRPGYQPEEEPIPLWFWLSLAVLALIAWAVGVWL